TIGKINLVNEEQAQPQDTIEKINLVSEGEGQPKDTIGKINLVNEEQAQPKDTIGKINLVSEEEAQPQDGLEIEKSVNRFNSGEVKDKVIAELGIVSQGTVAPDPNLISPDKLFDVRPINLELKVPDQLNVGRVSLDQTMKGNPQPLPEMLVNKPDSKGTLNLGGESKGEVIDLVSKDILISDRKTQADLASNNEFSQLLLSMNKGLPLKPDSKLEDQFNFITLLKGESSAPKSLLLKSDPSGIDINSPKVESSIIDQIVLKGRESIRANSVSQMTISLNPPQLGRIDMKVVVVENRLKAFIVAESSEVKAILDSNIDQLRAKLLKEVSAIDEISITVADEQSGFEFHEGQENNLEEENDREVQGKGGTVFDSEEILQLEEIKNFIGNNHSISLKV
ncbi:MAG: flagellar hook-length control protein FliK, partial [Nitrospinota bacterium]